MEIVKVKFKNSDIKAILGSEGYTTKSLFEIITGEISKRFPVLNKNSKVTINLEGVVKDRLKDKTVWFWKSHLSKEFLSYKLEEEGKVIELLIDSMINVCDSRNLNPGCFYAGDILLLLDNYISKSIIRRVIKRKLTVGSIDIKVV